MTTNGNAGPKQPTERLTHPIRITEQTWPEGTVPLVSVLCITYNHEKYIEQCLESFLMQETTFPVEIIIHDDASTDQTPEILREHQARYPKLIKAIFQRQNQWTLGKKIIPIIMPLARGQFIATCEGDDYWSCSEKLQIQADFLEENPSYSACLHNSLTFYENGRQSHLRVSPEDGIPPWDSIDNACQLILGHFNKYHLCPAHTSSFFYRNILGGIVTSEFCADLISGDIALLILISEKGRLKFIDKVMSCYRIHENGTSSSSAHGGQNLLRNRIALYESLKPYVCPNTKGCLDTVIDQFREELSKQNHWNFRAKKFLKRLLQTLRKTVSSF